ncbi:hypothetical protein ACRQ5Q_18490 [Bradyrhizobium sp. PMVTL-01]|uniref:hypothetical protein n=1 Tax=Bradyrhizobium sp. PMVTL-01 TaxID=3434999 RepID=UPI003F72EF71
MPPSKRHRKYLANQQSLGPWNARELLRVVGVESAREFYCRESPPLKGFNGVPIIFGHVEQALPLKVKGSDGGVFSASPFEPAEFL